jgi:hypothetical protein
MPKAASEVLVPSEKKIKINGENLVVKPFSVKDLIFFARDIMDGMAEVKKKYPTLSFGPEDILQYFPALLDEAPRLFNLLARAVQKEGSWLESSTDLVGVSALFVVIAEINDFGTIISNFRTGWSKLQNQTIKASVAQ